MAADGGEPVDPQSVWWALRAGPDLIAAVLEKEQEYFDAIRRRGLDRIWALAYAQAFGCDPLNPYDFATQTLSYAGPEGSSLRWRIGEPRALVDEANIIARGDRPAWKCTALNSDLQSVAQIDIAKNVIKYLYEEKVGERLEREMGDACGWFGAGYWWCRWDRFAGDEVEVPTYVKGLPDPVSIPTISGMPDVCTLFPWDHAQEVYSKTSAWEICRERVSKWELMGEYKKFATQLLEVNNIRAQPGVAEMFAYDADAPTTDDVIVRHFYVKPCAACPQGRYAGIVEGIDAPLWDDPCPLPKRIPVVECMPYKYFGTRLGYAKSWDILSIQEAEDEVVSMELTNYITFGRQNMFVPMGTDYDEDAIAEGLNVFKVPLNSQPPVIVGSAPMPEGIANLKDYCGQKKNAIMGLNQVARGQSDETVKSGVHAALRDHIAIRFQNPTHAALITARNELANMLLDMVKANARGPFLVEVAGVGEESYLQQYEKSSISGVRRVRVNQVSPEMESYASRLEIFLRVAGLEKEDRAGAIHAIETGDWSKWIEKPKTCDALVRFENEQMLKGIPVSPKAGENPFDHLPEHMSELEKQFTSETPNMQVIQLLGQHIQETIPTWLLTNPFIQMFLKVPQAAAMFNGMTGQPANQAAMLALQGIFPPNTSADIQHALAKGGAPTPPVGGPAAPSGGEEEGGGKDGEARGQHPTAGTDLPNPAKPPGKQAA